MFPLCKVVRLLWQFDDDDSFIYAQLRHLLFCRGAASKFLSDRLS
jgi:hypothetical protein